MSDAKIARVYAEALFQAASEAGRTQAVRNDLASFVAAARGSEQLQEFFQNQSLPEESRKRVVMELAAGADPLVRNFLRVLIDKRREDVLEEAGRHYQQRVEAADNRVTVELTTARPISKELQAEVRSSLESSLQSTVELMLAVDESILGGAKLRIGDKIADASIRHRLDQLRARLISPTAKLEGSVEAAS
ncbi:MAG: ATP synthase F1 subunit delta [Gaiellales bacterium]|nr:ATP synthase F1 subunit delta [Gaiellales bacterium]